MSETLVSTTDSPSSVPSLAPLLDRIAALVPGWTPAEGESPREALFPITRRYAFLNHAALTPPSLPVVRRIERFLHELSRHGSLAWDELARAEDRVREKFARLIHAETGTIALAKSVSDALMLVADGLPWQPGDNIVTAECEFPSNVYPWLNLAARGVEVRFTPARDERIQLKDLAQRIDEHTRLVSLSFVEFGTGYRNDVRAVADLAHAAGALLCVDGIQGLGALDLDVQTAAIDFLAGGSPKWLMGPSHAGLLYVRPDHLEMLHPARRGWTSVTTPFAFFDYTQALRPDAVRLEGGSNPMLPLAGLEAALDVLLAASIEQIEPRVLALADLVRVGLREAGHDIISPDEPGERSGIVCFRPAGAGGVPAERLVARLASEARVVVSARNGLVRVSPHFYNTDGDVARLHAALGSIRAG